MQNIQDLEILSAKTIQIITNNYLNMRNVDNNTFLSINLKSIAKNYLNIRKRVGRKCIVASTVKGDAYGLGASKVVPALIKEGCNNFFVATTNEAIQLREINKKINIYILNGLVSSSLALIEEYRLIPVINNLAQLSRIEKYQNRHKKRLDIALHFDTGMSRLGFDKKETDILLDNKNELIKKSKILLIMSHLACADNKKSSKNTSQLKRFLMLQKYFPNVAFSLSNSAGILLGKKYHFDMVRPGISLYGGHCTKSEGKIYENVVKLKAKLIQIREIYKNDTIGYGGTYRAKSKMIIGTLAFGYADGFNRLFSNNYFAIYKNKKFNLVGRVSMDLITINLTAVRDLKLIKNKEIEIINDKYSINTIAKLINTIPYEILTNLGKRYQRLYISK